MKYVTWNIGFVEKRNKGNANLRAILSLHVFIVYSIMHFIATFHLQNLKYIVKNKFIQCLIGSVLKPLLIKNHL